MTWLTATMIGVWFIGILILVYGSFWEPDYHLFDRQERFASQKHFLRIRLIGAALCFGALGSGFIFRSVIGS